MNQKKTSSIRKSNTPLKLITKDEQSDSDIKGIFKLISEKINGKDYDELQDFRKAVIVFLDDNNTSANRQNYEYTVISVNLPSSEAITLLEVVKYDIIKDMSS